MGATPSTDLADPWLKTFPMSLKDTIAADAIEKCRTSGDACVILKYVNAQRLKLTEAEKQTFQHECITDLSARADNPKYSSRSSYVFSDATTNPAATRVTRISHMPDTAPEVFIMHTKCQSEQAGVGPLAVGPCPYLDNDEQEDKWKHNREPIWFHVGR
jgi:hypothetical protein